MTKMQTCARAVNDGFAPRLDAAFQERFGLELKTRFDLLGTMRYVSERADENPLTPEQHQWVSAYSAGYLEALAIVRSLK
jgi:hypothetical protein